MCFVNDFLQFMGNRPRLPDLMRGANLVLRSAIRRDAVAALARLSEPVNQQRMLFVVGAARSGTTALQAALNASEEVFLLGEANFFRENLKAGFRARYNARHRTFGHPPSKQNDCPAVAPENGTWVETVLALAQRHVYIGEKVAFGAFAPDRWIAEFLAFQGRYFRGATYILAFRNPRDAILSPRVTWGVPQLLPWAASYIATARGLIHLRRQFPRTVPVFLETVGPSTFQAIERSLDWRLPQLSGMVGSRPMVPRGRHQVPIELRDTIDALEALYPALRQAIEDGSISDCGPLLDAIDAELAGLRARLGPLR
jgi:hypothetical protein